MQNGHAVVGKVQSAKFDFAFDLCGLCARRLYFCAILDFRLLHQDFVDASHGRRASLENVDDPTQGDHRPGQLHHVGVEGDKATHGDASAQDFASPEPKHQHNGEAQHGFQRGPEHAHQADQLQAAVDVFAVGSLERRDLRLFLHIGADHAGAGEILLGPGRDLRKHRLDLLEPLVNQSAEVLHHDAHRRQWQEGVERQLGTDREHEGQGTGGKHDRVRGIHDSRAQQHADGVQVVGRPGHDVAGAGALVVGVRKAFQVLEQIVAQVKLDLAGNADHDPAGQELKDALGRGYGQQCRE